MYTAPVTPHETILMTTRRIRFVDDYTVKRGTLCTFLGLQKQAFGDPDLAVLFPDGQKRIVKQSDVTEHE